MFNNKKVYCFSLIEMIGVVTIFTIVIIALFQAFNAFVIYTQNEQKEQEALKALEFIMKEIRTTIAFSECLSVNNNNLTVIDQFGDNIRYTISTDGALLKNNKPLVKRDITFNLGFFEKHLGGSASSCLNTTTQNYPIAVKLNVQMTYKDILGQEVVIPQSPVSLFATRVLF